MKNHDSLKINKCNLIENIGIDNYIYYLKKNVNNNSIIINITCDEEIKLIHSFGGTIFKIEKESIIIVEHNNIYNSKETLDNLIFNNIVEKFMLYKTEYMTCIEFIDLLINICVDFSIMEPCYERLSILLIITILNNFRCFKIFNNSDFA